MGKQSGPIGAHCKLIQAIASDQLCVHKNSQRASDRPPALGSIHQDEIVAYSGI